MKYKIDDAESADLTSTRAGWAPPFFQSPQALQTQADAQPTALIALARKITCDEGNCLAASGVSTIRRPTGSVAGNAPY